MATALTDRGFGAELPRFGAGALPAVGAPGADGVASLAFAVADGVLLPVVGDPGGRDVVVPGGGGGFLTPGGGGGFTPRGGGGGGFTPGGGGGGLVVVVVPQPECAGFV